MVKGLLLFRTAMLLMRVAVVLIAASILLPTATAVQGASLDQDLFPKGYPILLAFDLQDDERPSAGLIVGGAATNLPASDFNITLPFKILNEGVNEKGLFRVGRYSTWTLITFSNMNNVWPQAIDFVPEFDRSTEAYNASQTGGSTIYLTSEGQLRRFRYRYPNVTSSKSLASIPQNFQTRNPDAIALALPKGAQEVAVAPNKLSIPPRQDPDGVFPAVSPDPNQQFLEIAYQVPPTSLQRAVVKWGVKAIGAILPIAGLFFLTPEQIRSRKLRSRLDWRRRIFFHCHAWGDIMGS